MLILVGITLNGLHKAGLLSKTDDTYEKVLMAQKKENEVLNQYEQEIENSRGNKLTYSSNYINSVEISGKQVNDYMDININISKKQEYSNLALVLFKNGIMYDSYKKNEIENNNINVYGIKPNTDYIFYVYIIDEQGGILKSNEFNIKSASNIYAWRKAEYPVLSNNIINNMEYSDQYGNVVEYKKDLNEGACTASDALPIQAWDDNTSTAVRTGTFYIKIANDMIGKLLVWNQYWTSGCTSIFTFCDENKNSLGTKWGSDITGSKTIIDNTKYLQYYSNGHYLYEIYGK